MADRFKIDPIAQYLEHREWTAEQGEGARAWIANEGIRVSALVRSILMARDDDPHAARIAAILAFEPPTQMRSAFRGSNIAPRAEDPSAYPDLPAFESTRFTAPAFLKEVPLDPYTGKPLLFKRLSDGLVIYGVYTDGKDDGGDTLNGPTATGYHIATDVGFPAGRALNGPAVGPSYLSCTSCSDPPRRR